MAVKAKRAGWNEQLTPEQELDLDPYEATESDLQGDLEVVSAEAPDGKPFEVYLVGGQEADPSTIEEDGAEDMAEGQAPEEVAGRDGEKAESLLRHAKAEGVAVFADLAQRALGRWLKGGRRGKLFTDGERHDMADMLAAVNGTADLLGRARIVLRTRRATKHAEGTPWEAFDESPLKPLAPERALHWFRSLVPELSINPEQWVEDLRERTFKLAVATEAELQSRVQDVIAGRLETGQGISTAPRDIKALMDEAGVSTRNPQYAEMVLRTNMMNALNEAQEQEIAENEEQFPVWRWDGISDGRQRHSHEVHFGHYFPARVAFSKVRDSVKGSYDGFNDRCTPTPIHRVEWAELQRSGARIKDGW